MKKVYQRAGTSIWNEVGMPGYGLYDGNAFELSPDPLAHTVCPIMEQVKLGETADAEAILAPLLHNEAIFGVDLYEAGLAELVCRYFNELIAGPGAVRATLHKYTA